MSNKILSVIIVTLLISFNVVAQTSNKSEMNPTDAAVLQKWLATKPSLRLATEGDYTKESLDFARQSEGENFAPFYLSKDFNGDRKEDFAVILTRKKGKKTFAVAVFNAPFGRQPNFFSTQIEPGDVLYFNPNTKRLMVGPYASDAGFALKPTGKTYKIQTFGD